MFVRNVVCKFKFMEGDNFLHPLFPSCRTVRMDVHPLGHLWVSFASNHPLAKKVTLYQSLFNVVFIEDTEHEEGI